MTKASNLGKGGSNFNTSGQLDLTTGVTGTLPAANGGTGTTSFPAPGTTGNVLTSNGTAWTSAAAAAFDTGTLMLFQQTSAPTGWTKQTTHNNKALRVVSGTASSGGTTAFTTVFANQTPTITTTAGTLAVGAGTFAVAATTLTSTQIPSHTHTYQPGGSGCGSGGIMVNGDPAGFPTRNVGSTGGGGSHTHSLSGAPSLSGSPSSSSSAITLDVQYVDLIIASKN